MRFRTAALLARSAFLAMFRDARGAFEGLYLCLSRILTHNIAFGRTILKDGDVLQVVDAHAR